MMANWAGYQEKLIGEKVVKRAKHAIHFAQKDGSTLALFSGASCHYLDGGIYKPIDTKLVLSGDGFYGCAHSPVKIGLDGNVKIMSAGKADYTQRAELVSAQEGKVDGDKVIREFDLGYQSLQITEDGFHSDVVLNKAPSEKEASKLFAVETGSLATQFKRSETVITDAKGDVHIYAGIKDFMRWIDGAEFPVVIDPDFAGGTLDAYLTGSNADYATARATSTDRETGSKYLYVGQQKPSDYVIRRGYLLFDTSSIGSGGAVTQVNLSMTEVLAQLHDTDFDLQIVKYDWSEFAGSTSNSTYRETAYDGCLAADADDSIWRNTAGMSLNTQYTSGNLSTSWISKTGVTYYGLISSRDKDGTTPSNNELITIGSQNNATTGYRPILSVTYTAGSSGVPKQFMHYARQRGR